MTLQTMATGTTVSPSTHHIPSSLMRLMSEQHLAPVPPELTTTTLFQSVRNSLHHIKSERATLLRLTWWLGFATVALKSKRRRMKVLPGHTTAAACCDRQQLPFCASVSLKPIPYLVTQLIQFLRWELELSPDAVNKNP